MNRKKIIFISMFSLLILIVCAVLFLFFNKNKTIEVNKLTINPTIKPGCLYNTSILLVPGSIFIPIKLSKTFSKLTICPSNFICMPFSLGIVKSNNPPSAQKHINDFC